MINTVEHIHFETFVANNFIVLSDAEKKTVLKWRNHDDIRKWMYTIDIISEKDHFKFIEKLRNDSGNGYFLVSENSRGIGVISLNEVNYNEKKADLGIYAKPGLKGYGSILLRVIKYIAFEVLYLNVLKAEVFASNEKAISLYKKNGFVKVNLFEKRVLTDGRQIDIALYANYRKRITI
jgi:UDP-4-amino-4,6-dideoxy-N-acetyl-beta-L-altrosamine N-acetyltransferase